MSSEDVPEGIDDSWEPEYEITDDEEEELFNTVKSESNITRDPFEVKKQSLRDEQENEYANPDHKYVEIKIPTNNKIGGKCIIKFSDGVPKAQVAVSQQIDWKKRDKYDKESKPELISHAFILDEHKAKGDKMLKEVSFVWEDIGVIAQEKRNLLKAGEYLVEVRAWNNESWEETTARRLVKVK